MDSLILFAAQYLILVPPVVFLIVYWKLGMPARRQMFIFMLAIGVLGFWLGQIASHLYVN
ncbi:MAG: hypothetical protein JWO96_751, partial [Candidatus Saccharibacteria bacterium]|nr:hypothetical protein [Candidatus Saccharibacteria bacterium]